MAKYARASYLTEILGVSRQRVDQLIKARDLKMPEIKKREGVVKLYLVSDLDKLARRIRSFNSKEQIKKIKPGSKLITIQQYSDKTGMGPGTVRARLKVLKQRSPKDLPALAGKARQIETGRPNHFYVYADLDRAIKLSKELLKQRGRPKKD